MSYVGDIACHLHPVLVCLLRTQEEQMEGYAPTMAQPTLLPDPTQDQPVKAPPRRSSTASQVAHWITCKEDQLLEWQKKDLSHLCEADQEIREANELIQEFTTMLRERNGECFDAWLEKVEQQAIPELCGFVQSLKKDYEAVKAGLTLAWSQGPGEGHVHRLKLLKRQAYGRAGFQTLRKRVLRCS